MAIIQINPSNPEEHKIKFVSEMIMDDKIIICPTDTLYAIVCKLSNKNGIEKICKIVGKKPEKANLSIICSSLKHISDYSLQFNKNIYKIMNRNLPGPYTFILKANNKIPKLFLSKRKTIGIRVPNHEIPLNIVNYIDEPLVCASVNLSEESEFTNQIDEIENQLGNQVDMMIDAGNCQLIGSSVIDCTGEEPELIREGLMKLN
jgi:tRNA threonylcarbamoyl adenosine modification protein (Sua5/YciO/YrdC/YwlC family)